MVKKINEIFDSDRKNWVSLFVGRFQPFTLGHLRCVEKLYEEFGVPVVICMIPTTEKSADKEHPFYGELQQEMFRRLKDGLKQEKLGVIADVIEVKNAFIDDVIATVKNETGMQPIAWGCGTDRYEIKKNVTVKSRCNDCGFERKRAMERCTKCGSTNITNDTEERIEGYKPMHDGYIERQKSVSPEEQNIDPENFNLLHIKRDVGEIGDDEISKISGTKVRMAIMNNDFNAFQRMVPKCLSTPGKGLFDDFKFALDKIYGNPQETQNISQEPAKMGVYEGLMRDREYRKYRKRLDEAITRLVKKTRKDIIL